MLPTDVEIDRATVPQWQLIILASIADAIKQLTEGGQNTRDARAFFHDRNNLVLERMCDFCGLDTIAVRERAEKVFRAYQEQNRPKAQPRAKYVVRNGEMVAR